MRFQGINVYGAHEVAFGVAGAGFFLLAALWFGYVAIQERRERS
jgi:hypothetical protein